MSGSNSSSPGVLHLILPEGGQATILSIEGERVVVAAPQPFPPGSSLTGSDVVDGAEYRVKVRGCRRDPQSSSAGPRFLVEGRLVNLSKLQREALAQPE